MATTKKTNKDFQHCKLRECSHARAPWRVSYPVTGTDGKTTTKRRQFAALEDAIEFCRQIDNQIENHGRRFGAAPPEALRAFDRFRDMQVELEELGLEVPVFEDLVLEAVRRFRTEALASTSKRVCEAVQEYLAFKKTRVAPKTYDMTAWALGSFSIAFGRRPLDQITQKMVTGWVGNGGKASTRNQKTVLIIAWLNYAVKVGWIEKSPMTGWHRERVAFAEPRAYTTEEAQRLLQTAQAHLPEILPFVVLGLFAGLRPVEARQIDLGSLPAKAGSFRVPPAKIPLPRLAEMTEAGIAWMATQPRRRGLAWLGKTEQCAAVERRLFSMAGVQKISDGFRHTYISNAVAITRNPALIADQCGNSADIINRNYRELRTEEEALRFFALRPAGGEVVELKHGRKAL